MRTTEEWVALDGTDRSARSEVMTFAGDTLFTIRAHDGDKPPSLRAAPLTNALNDAVRTMAGGRSPQVTVQAAANVRLIGIQFAAMSEPSVLVRVTPDDVEMERSRGETEATVESIATEWSAALRRALDSVAAMNAGESR